jgi:integrase
MTFLLDPQELKTGLIIFRRGDVKHRNWYYRIKLPRGDRYKTVCLKTSDVDAAKERAFDEDADLRFRIKQDVPIFNRPFSGVAKDLLAQQKERAEVHLAPVRPRALLRVRRSKSSSGRAASFRQAAKPSSAWASRGVAILRL